MFGLRLPDREGNTALLERDLKQLSTAVNKHGRGIFSKVILPQGNYKKLKLDRSVGTLIPSFSGLERHEAVMSAINRLSPDEVLVVNGFQTIVDPYYRDKAFKLVEYLAKESQQQNRKWKLWGDLHLNGEGVEPIKSMFAAGFTGVIAGSTSLDGGFQQNLDAYYLQQLHRQGGAVAIAIPYISNLADLLSWHEHMQLDISGNLRAQAIVELFERADRDGNKKFIEDWNRAQFERAWGMIGADEVQIVPFSNLKRCVKLLAQSQQVITTPLSKDFLIDVRHERAEMINALSPMPVIISDIVFSHIHRPTSNSASYFDQCHAALKEIVQAFNEVRKEFPDNKLWQELSVSIDRPTMIGIGRTAVTSRGIYNSAEDYLAGQRPEKRQILISLRPGMIGKAGATQASVAKKLRELCQGQESTEDRFYIPGRNPGINADTDSGMDRLGLEGYKLVCHAREIDFIQSSPETKDRNSAGLVGLVNHPHIINRSAKAFSRVLKKTKVRRPVIVEPGSYEANGVEEVLKSLKLPKRQKVEMAFSDFDPIALGTCEVVLGKKRNKKIKFGYTLLDSTKEVKTGYEQAGLTGRIVAGRSATVLDAVGSDSIASINGKFYQVAAKTFLNRQTLQSAIRDNKRYDTKPGFEGRFSYQEYGITVEEIAGILHQKVDPEDPQTASVNRFLALCWNKNLPEHRAYFLWKCVYESLEQSHDYIEIDLDKYEWVKDGKGKPLNHLLKEVLLSHPGNYIIPDSAKAIEVLNGILPLIEKGGVFLSAQLTTSINDCRASYYGWRRYGTTFAMPICWDLIKAWAEYHGYEVKRTLGSQFKPGENGEKMTDTNSLIEFRIKKNSKAQLP